MGRRILSPGAFGSFEIIVGAIGTSFFIFGLRTMSFSMTYFRYLVTAGAGSSAGPGLPLEQAFALAQQFLGTVICVSMVPFFFMLIGGISILTDRRIGRRLNVFWIPLCFFLTAAFWTYALAQRIYSLIIRHDTLFWIKILFYTKLIWFPVLIGMLLIKHFTDPEVKELYK